MSTLQLLSNRGLWRCCMLTRAPARLQAMYIQATSILYGCLLCGFGPGKRQKKQKKLNVYFTSNHGRTV